MSDESNILKQDCIGTLLQKLVCKTFVQYVTVWFVWMWIYTNVDEKAQTFS